MGRRRLKEISGGDVTGSLARLEQELHAKRAAEPVRTERVISNAGTTTAAANLVLGRLVQTDALQAVQEKLAAASRERGFTAIGRRVNPGIIYAAVLRPDAPTSQYDLEQALRTRAVDKEECRADVALFDSVHLVGGLALAYERRRKNSRASTLLFLGAQDPDEAARLHAEHMAVTALVNPEQVDDVAAKQPRINLLTLTGTSSNSVMRDLLAEPLPLPEDMVLGPVTAYDGAAVPCRP